MCYGGKKMIFYFSGTGNSRYVAEMFGEGLQDKVVDATIWIKNQKKGEFQSDKPWVFISPTYAWQLPGIFQQFIREADFKGSNSAYFIMTCGADIGNANINNAKLCKQIGLEYKGTLEIVMPENYIAMYPVPDKDGAKKIVEEAIPVMKKGIQIIKEGKFIQHRKNVLNDKLKSGIVNPIFYRFIVKSKKFKVNNQCISCGKCARVCPLNNVYIDKKIPRWGDHCTHCMACICGCPKEAIEYGKTSVGQPRYECVPYQKQKIN